MSCSRQRKLRLGVLAFALVVAGATAATDPSAARALDVLHAGDFLVDLQAENGSLFAEDPPNPSDEQRPLEQDNITGFAAKGLLGAARFATSLGQLDDADRYLDAAVLAGARLLTREGNFATPDALFLIELTDITGDPRYRAFAASEFFDALAAGTYVRQGVELDLEAFIERLFTVRSGTRLNLRVWDLAFLVRGASRLGHPLAADLRVRMQQALDDLAPSVFNSPEDPEEPNRFDDTSALAHAIVALVEAGDPDGYVYAGESFPQLTGLDLVGLADFLAAAQIPLGDPDAPNATAGAFPFFLRFAQNPQADEVQATAYAATALAQFGPRYAAEVEAAVAYLGKLQDPDHGGVVRFLGSADLSGAVGAEIAAEAIMAATTRKTIEVLPDRDTLLALPTGASLRVPAGALEAAALVTLGPAAGAIAELLLQPVATPIEVATDGAALFLVPAELVIPLDPLRLPPGADAAALAVLRVTPDGETEVLAVQAIAGAGAARFLVPGEGAYQVVFAPGLAAGAGGPAAVVVSGGGCALGAATPPSDGLAGLASWALLVVGLAGWRARRRWRCARRLRLR